MEGFVRSRGPSAKLSGRPSCQIGTLASKADGQLQAVNSAKLSRTITIYVYLYL